MPQNINNFEKIFCERQYPHKHNTTKSQKLKKVVWTWRELTPQRTSTYRRPFTHEGNYLVDILEIHTVPAPCIFFL